MQKNHQHLVRPCAVLVERLNETFIPSKRYKVDADIIYRSFNEQPSSHAHDELSVDVLMLPNNKVKISSSSAFEDIPSSIAMNSTANDDIKPMVRIRAHQSSIDSVEHDGGKRASSTTNASRRFEASSSSNKYDSDSYLFNTTFDSDDELGMDLNDDELASIHRVLDFDEDDMSNFDDESPHLSSTAGPGYHQVQLPDLVMGSLRADSDVKFEPSFQYSDLFNRKGRTFVCDERGNRVVSVKLDKNSAKRLIDAIERNLGRLVLEECRRGDLQAHILKVRRTTGACHSRTVSLRLDRLQRRTGILRLQPVGHCLEAFVQAMSRHVHALPRESLRVTIVPERERTRRTRLRRKQTDARRLARLTCSRTRLGGRSHDAFVLL